MRYWRGIRRRWNTLRPPKICTDTIAWAVEHGAKYHTFEKFPSYTRRLPCTIEPEISREYTSRLQGPAVGKFLVILQNAKLVSKRGIVVLPDGQFCKDSVNTLDQIRNDPVYSLLPKERVEKTGTYFSLINAWNHTYYHWIHDSLLRLFQVQDYLPADIKFIVPPNLRPWHLETLRVFGVPEGKLVEFNGSQVWELERLYFTNRTNNSGSNHPVPDFWLRNHFFRYFDVKETDRSLRLYVSRNKTRQRHVLNEDDVWDLLKPRGFERVYPESLSIGEQVKLFSRAAVVMGPHGSAFANLYFAPEGSIAVDIVEASMDSYRYVFWSLANVLGHQYWTMDADSVTNSSGQPDMHVPVEKLKATLAEIGIS